MCMPGVAGGGNCPGPVARRRLPARDRPDGGNFLRFTRRPGTKGKFSGVCVQCMHAEKHGHAVDPWRRTGERRGWRPARRRLALGRIPGARPGTEETMDGMALVPHLTSWGWFRLALPGSFREGRWIRRAVRVTHHHIISRRRSLHLGWPDRMAAARRGAIHSGQSKGGQADYCF